MKRQDYILFFLLIAALFAWPGFYQKFFAEPPVPRPVEESAVEPAAPDATGAPAAEATATASTALTAPVSDTAILPEETTEAAATEARLDTLSNELLRLVVSSQGAGVVEATLLGYRDQLAADSELITFDFTDRPALAYRGVSGLGDASGFTPVEVTTNRIVYEGVNASGLALRREIALGEHYLVTVTDTFANRSAAAIELGGHQIGLGPIPREAAHQDIAGMVDMGVDTLPVAAKVENWGKRIPKQFKNERDDAGLADLPRTISWRPPTKPIDWVSAKNKYFVQILKPDGDGADWFEIYAEREVADAEIAGRRVKEAVIEAVAGSLGFNSETVGPGDAYTRVYEYYVGPKDYRVLAGMSHGRESAMGFEENAYLDFLVVPMAKLLLRLLNFLYDHVYANYGVAIILLTVIVRVVFWPITHKSTESMRRMASVQPLMAEIKEKYKDNPQKMQQAMMALYKEHKINPLGGCLPMLVQIPVFFALFVVLRIGIELRFAEFLWIRDLSAPERLIEFGFAIPLLGWDALNILPLLMTGTMILQMKLSPTAGDPAQQKIMMVMMPLMMLFFLYNFASGLALYWTTQNVLMIVQQLIYQRRKKHEAATAPA
jgi:YidC/Oxa1 family membrane protein insertase